MVFEQIEQLKQQYTDKYVIVDESRPELRRFQGQTGIVRTVNMSGRALVEFDAYKNTGWYDIELDFLKVIDKPLEKPESSAKSDAKPAAAKAKPAAAKKAPGKMSVEEMLAAARGEKGGGAAAAKPAAKKAAAATAAAGAKADPKKMSVEEMLAAARGEKAGGAKAAPAEATPEPAPEATPEPAAPAPAAVSKGDMPTDTDGIVAYCRKTDGS